MRKYKARLILLTVLSFIASAAPLLIVLVCKFGDYTKTPADKVKLGAGAIIIAVFLLLKVLGKLRMPRRIITFATLFLLVYLLEAVLTDLLLLTGMALIGEFIDVLCFQTAIRNTRERITSEKTADATAEKVEELLKTYVGRV